jgi:CheY-like chemotaxis protein
MNNLTFLLVDDDLDDQEIFMLALNEVDAAIHCDFANDGILGLDYLGKNAGQLPDFIFLDLNMPRMGGMEFLKEIKQSELFKNIPVIIYSTSSEPIFVKKTLEMGANDYLVKPSTLSGLIHSLKIFVREIASAAG